MSKAIIISTIKRAQLYCCFNNMMGKTPEINNTRVPFFISSEYMTTRNSKTRNHANRETRNQANTKTSKQCANDCLCCQPSNLCKFYKASSQHTQLYCCLNNIMGKTPEHNNTPVQLFISSEFATTSKQRNKESCKPETRNHANKNIYLKP